MSYTNGLDVSQYQGDIDWPSVRAAGYEIAIVKISGGDGGSQALYFDPTANRNYYFAKDAGLAVGGYHFAGGGDPVSEAEFFVRGMSPVVQDDVFVLDWEVQHADPVGWCQSFVNRVHELTGVWCIVYMNGSTRNAYDWSPVAANCGMWIAWYGKDPEGDLPVTGAYIAHQYTSSGSVPGISGSVDLDAFYLSIDQFKRYGYQEAQPAPVPAPEAPTQQPPAGPAPTPAEAPQTAPEPAQHVPESAEPSQPTKTPKDAPAASPEPTAPTRTLADWVSNIINIVTSFLKSWKR